MYSHIWTLSEAEISLNKEIYIIANSAQAVWKLLRKIIHVDYKCDAVKQICKFEL